MKRSASHEDLEVRVETRGEVPPETADYARAKVLNALAKTRKPIRFARVRLTHMANPAMQRPIIAQVNVNVDGRTARAHVAAATLIEAIDLLHDRLTRRLLRLAEHWEARRGATPVPAPHEWRHGSEPTRRPEYFPRPVEERQVVRHKSFSIARESPDEAARDMEVMDYHFHLFTDSASGEDSVLYEAGPTGFRLAQVHPRPDLLSDVSLPLTISDIPAPRMSVTAAKERLGMTGFAFVFFANAATGRGNILYHRYDGHYGLITPAE